MKLVENSRSTPYPTAQALLRELANAFDTKSYLSPQYARKLDDSCKKVDIHIGEFEDLKELTVTSPIRLIFGDEIWARVSIFLESLFKRYFQWIDQHPLDGLSVDQANCIFEKTNFFNTLVLFSFWGKDNYHQPICLPDNVDLVLYDQDAANRLLSLMTTKEARDRASLWLKGKEFPSLKYIKTLEQYSSGADLTQDEWQAIKWGIICSRFNAHFTPKSNREMMSFGEISNIFKMEHSKNAHNFLCVKRHIEQICEVFKNTMKFIKTDNDKLQMSHLLGCLKEKLSKFDNCLALDYTFHQFNAHHLTLDGQLEAANNEYKLAFEKLLYRGHSKYQIQIVIKEALLVAAYQKRPDKIFINKLKSTAILFGLDNLPAKTEVEGKNKIELFSGNEIEDLRYKFTQQFTHELAYPGVTYPDYPFLVGMIFEVEDTLINQLTKKQITIGMEGELQRKTTPLIYACMKNKVEDVVQLLDEGASVNVLSEVNDSPLLMSLAQMDFTDPTSSMDNRIFELISKKSHSEQIINAVTIRKINFPLFAAVATGNPNIVKKILSMNDKINIDLRGGLDWITPLYYVLGLINQVKNRHAGVEYFNRHITEENIHRLQPMYAGFENRKEIVRQESLSSRENKIFKIVYEIMMERYPTTPSKLRQIARILIKNGANVNKAHSINGMNYTPLMLAAENDEVNLFKLMIEHGGDWRKVYVLPLGIDSKKKAINCLDIAEYFKAKNVIEYIKDTLQHPNNLFI